MLSMVRGVTWRWGLAAALLAPHSTAQHPPVSGGCFLEPLDSHVRRQVRGSRGEGGSWAAAHGLPHQLHRGNRRGEPAAESPAELF